MKLIFAILATAALMTATDPQSKKTAPPPAKVIKPLEIPKEAVETEPGTFRYTDSEGKKWIYRKTPFGVARMEDSPAPAAAAAAKPADAAEGVKAIEDGDTV